MHKTHPFRLFFSKAVNLDVGVWTKWPTLELVLDLVARFRWWPNNYSKQDDLDKPPVFIDRGWATSVPRCLARILIKTFLHISLKSRSCGCAVCQHCTLSWLPWVWELPVLGRRQRSIDPPYNSPVLLGVGGSAGQGSRQSISIHVPPLTMAASCCNILGWVGCSICLKFLAVE